MTRMDGRFTIIFISCSFRVFLGNLSSFVLINLILALMNLLLCWIHDLECSNIKSL